MLKNKVIVVTGGAGLLGRHISMAAAEKGAIVIKADISGENDWNSGVIHMDITSEQSVKESIAAILDKYGRIDGWVNNAYPRTKDWGNKLEDVQFESWQRNIDMHLNGYFLCSKYALEAMRIQKAGALVNMSSIYGVVGPDFSVYEGTKMTMPVAYAAIKGGLVNLTRYLSAYYGPDNIRVNCVSPGGIFDHQPESFVKRYEAKVPLRRMGTPDDISPAVCFLLSDESRYITGHNLVVDGGWTAI
jgi:NAD(P)-dependent dehydrogenase (short-subunit alcohol dehydrogenase family)